MKQTVEEAVANHRKLWHGIADEIRKNRISLRGALTLKERVRNKLFPELWDQSIEDNCFLCDFAIEHKNGNHGVCHLCPLQSKDNRGCLNGLFGEFCRACEANNNKVAARLADKIADLPVVNPLYVKDGEAV